ncbi:MAG: hypothetical protein NTZ16_08760 [Verrucomicrobia bacterium]|nr:hypothetical protein [Verrucomicrobiota bacterium]
MTPAAAPRWWMRHRPLLTALLLALAAVLLHLPSVRYGFVQFDDVRILRDHPELYGRPALAENLRAIFITGFPREEPLLLRDVTWAVDGKIFGFGNPLGYHLGNVLLHGVVVALLFAFLLATTRRYRFALLTAAGFTALALHTETVAWIMGRKDLLAAFWMLLALLAQTRRLAAEKFSSRAGWFVVTLACVVAGLLSKISVLPFPLVLYLHAIFLPHLRGERPPSAPLQTGGAWWREGLLLLPALAAAGVVYFWYQHTLAQMGIFDRGYTARGIGHLWNLLMIDSMGFWLYLRQTFLPAQLSVLYTWPALQTVYPLWQMVLAPATVLALAGGGVWLFRRRKDLFFYYAAFFTLMITYLNLIYIGIWVADRYLYFSAFCLLAIAATICDEALRHPHRGVRIGVWAGVTVVFAVNVFQQLSYQPAWRNGETLWQYHVALPSPSPTAFENLAAHYYAAAQAEPTPARTAWQLEKMKVVVEAGLQEFWRDRTAPPPVVTWYLFFLQSLAQEVNGAAEAALASLETAERLNPKSDAVQLNLARLHRRLAHAVAAREHFARYLVLAFRGRPIPPEARQEAEALNAATPKP